MKGRIFGRLTVLGDSGKRLHSQIIWICLCRCGKIHEVVGISLKSGRTKSCGCLSREKATKHGDYGTRLYNIYFHMKSRCYRKTDHKYKNYGARGIKVCPSWLNDYLTFKSWALRNGYKDNLTIDKRDNNGNYSPKNCQWLTRAENTKKQMRERKIERIIKIIKIINEKI